MHALNNENICQGKWTKVNIKNPQEKSIVDYMIWSKPLLHHKKEMMMKNLRLTGESITNDKTNIFKLTKGL